MGGHHHPRGHEHADDLRRHDFAFAVLVSHVVRTGFYAPVNRIAGFLNVVNAGSAVPLKFNVYNDVIEQKTTDVLQFTVNSIPCSSDAPQDPVDFTVAGATSLRYD